MSMKGNCELSASVTSRVKNQQFIKVSVTFGEEYELLGEGSRENKYYELLESVQLRLIELADETKKTLEVINIAQPLTNAC